MRCPLCNARCDRLGVLGRLGWFRCIACGMEFDRKVRGQRPPCPPILVDEPTAREAELEVRAAWA